MTGAAAADWNAFHDSRPVPSRPTKGDAMDTQDLKADVTKSMARYADALERVKQERAYRKAYSAMHGREIHLDPDIKEHSVLAIENAEAEARRELKTCSAELKVLESQGKAPAGLADLLLDDVGDRARNVNRCLAALKAWREGGKKQYTLTRNAFLAGVIHPDAQPKGEERAKAAPMPLHPDERKILEALAKAKSTQNQYDLEALCQLSRRTVSKRLKSLREGGLTATKGKRGGEYITDKGRALIAH